MRVVELFGPTIQGEGPLAGRVTHFLRLGGCDYRCSWCDSMYAVDPKLVRQAPNLTPRQVAAELAELEPAPALTISGGNPALWSLEQLLELLRPRYRVLAAETQGSVWRDWLRELDSLVISPKPPSSGMTTPRHLEALAAFMTYAAPLESAALKVVVFDSADLTFAGEIHRAWPRVPFYVSVGTEADDEPADLGARFGWLAERVARTPSLHDVAVLPQLHVVAWGHRIGV